MTQLILSFLTAVIVLFLVGMVLFSCAEAKRYRNAQTETHEEMMKKEALYKAQLAKEKQANEKKKECHTDSSADNFAASIDVLHDYSRKN